VRFLQHFIVTYEKCRRTSSLQLFLLLLDNRSGGNLSEK